MGHIFLLLAHQQLMSLSEEGSLLLVHSWKSENWAVKRRMINSPWNAAWALKPELWLSLPPLWGVSHTFTACRPVWLQERVEGRLWMCCNQMERWSHLLQLCQLLLAQRLQLWFGSFNSSFNWRGGSGFRIGGPGHRWSFVADFLLLFLNGPFKFLLFSQTHSFSLSFLARNCYSRMLTESVLPSTDPKTLTTNYHLLTIFKMLGTQCLLGYFCCIWMTSNNTGSYQTVNTTDVSC